MNIAEYLSRPFPQSQNRWKPIISISFFISLFMLFFQPFGLSLLKSNYKSLFLIGYGGVTFIVLVLNLFLVHLISPKSFKEERWTVLKEILWLLWILFTIGLGNFIYTRLIIFYPKIDFNGILIFQAFTLSVGLIPIVILIILKQNRLLAKNLKIAAELNQSIAERKKDIDTTSQRIVIIAENEKDKVEVDLNDFLFLEATGNYIKVVYNDKELIKNKLLRSSLKRIETMLIDFPDVIKCHRAFMVNITKIIQVKGNSQGYRLQLEGIDDHIPVARSFSKNVNQKIKEILS